MNIDFGSEELTTPWPKRLIIAGTVILCISMILMWTEWDDFSEGYDPDQNNIAKVAGGTSEQVNLTKGHTYIAFRLNSTSSNCTIIEMHTGAEVGRDSPGNWRDRPTHDQEYKAVGVYVPEASGVHSIEFDAESNEYLWIVDEQSLESYLLFQLGSFGLICGCVLLPIGMILWFTSQKKSYPTGLVMNDGEITHRVPTTDEVWASVHGGEPLNLTMPNESIEEEVPPPFADRSDEVRHSPLAIDDVDNVDESIPSNDDEDTAEKKDEWKSWDEG